MSNSQLSDIVRKSTNVDISRLDEAAHLYIVARGDFLTTRKQLNQKKAQLKKAVDEIYELMTAGEPSSGTDK